MFCTWWIYQISCTLCRSTTIYTVGMDPQQALQDFFLTWCTKYPMLGVFYHWAANMEGPNLELPESTWVAWTFISDPGSHAGEVSQFIPNCSHIAFSLLGLFLKRVSVCLITNFVFGGLQNGFRRRFVAVPLSMGGMLFFALLISLTSDAVSARVDQLKKGSSTVLEENHTLIVGKWWHCHHLHCC
jgi:hypothetical protein